MLKKILSYGFIEAFARGLNRLIILVLPFFIPIDSYGIVGLILAAELIIPMASILGFDKAVIRFYHEKTQWQDFSSTVYSTITFLHLFLLIIILFFKFIGVDSFLGLKLFPHCIILIVNVYLLNVIQIYLNIQRVEDNHKSYFRNRLSFQIYKFGVILIFVLFIKSELAYLFGVLISLLLIIAFNITILNAIIKFAINKKTLKKLLTFSWPFIIHGFASTLLGNVDRFILQKYIKLADLAIYTLSYSIGSSLSFAFQGISIYLEPIIYQSKSNEERELKLRYYLGLAFIGGSAFLILIILGTYFIIPQLLDKVYSKSFVYIPIIAFAHLLNPFYFSANYRLMFFEKSLSIAKISILTSILNFVLCFSLIPYFGLFAAAYCTLLSNFLLSFLMTYQSHDWKWSHENLAIIILFLTILLLSIFVSLLVYLTLAILILLVSIYFLFKVKKKG